MGDVSNKLTLFQSSFKPGDNYSVEQIKHAFAEHFERGIDIAYLFVWGRLHFEIAKEDLSEIFLEVSNKLGSDVYDVIPETFKIAVAENCSNGSSGITIFQRVNIEGRLFYKCVGYEPEKRAF